MEGNLRSAEPTANPTEQQEHMLNSMWRDRNFTDMCVLTEEGSVIPCHRSVLSSRSPVLDTMLSSEMQEGSQRQVSFPDVVFEDANIFLEYLYTNRLPATMRPLTASNLLRLGDMYEIPDLVDTCANRLQSSSNKDCISLVLRCLCTYQEMHPNAHGALRSVIDRIKKDDKLLWKLCHLVASEAVCTVAAPVIATQMCESQASEGMATNVQCDSAPQPNCEHFDVFGSSPHTIPQSRADNLVTNCETKSDTISDSNSNTNMVERCMDEGGIVCPSEPIIEVPAAIGETEAEHIQQERWATVAVAVASHSHGWRWLWLWPATATGGCGCGWLWPATATAAGGGGCGCGCGQPQPPARVAVAVPVASHGHSHGWRWL